MKRPIILTLSLLISSILFAQVDFQINNFSIKIYGTSTLHDWSADVQTVKGNADIIVGAETIEDIKRMSVKIDANSIKSEKGSMMDKNIYKALKTKDYGFITFNLTKVNSISFTGKKINLSVNGDLNIAGTSKTVNLSATGIIGANAYTFKGTKKLKMTDFNVEPPEFMLGAMKTGNEISIDYEITFTNNGLTSK